MKLYSPLALRHIDPLESDLYHHVHTNCKLFTGGNKERCCHLSLTPGPLSFQPIKQTPRCACWQWASYWVWLIPLAAERHVPFIRSMSKWYISMIGLTRALPITLTYKSACHLWIYDTEEKAVEHWPKCWWFLRCLWVTLCTGFGWHCWLLFIKSGKERRRCPRAGLLDPAREWNWNLGMEGAPAILCWSTWPERHQAASRQSFTFYCIVIPVLVLDRVALIGCMSSVNEFLKGQASEGVPCM